MRVQPTALTFIRKGSLLTRTTSVRKVSAWRTRSPARIQAVPASAGGVRRLLVRAGKLAGQLDSSAMRPALRLAAELGDGEAPLVVLLLARSAASRRHRLRAA